MDYDRLFVSVRSPFSFLGHRAAGVCVYKAELMCQWVGVKKAPYL